MTHGATTDAVDGVVDGIGVTSIDDDAKALSGKQIGDCQADTPRAADDYRSVQASSSWPNFMASMFQ